jgi:hypothetical protein
LHGPNIISPRTKGRTRYSSIINTRGSILSYSFNLKLIALYLELKSKYNMDKPTVLLVSGCWLPAEIYSGTIEHLSKSSYPAVAMALPSRGADPPHKDFWGDVEGIRSCLSNLVEVEEKEVILAMHSYAGMPGGEAPRGLGRKEREAQGLRGGVVRLVFIVSYLVPEGFSPEAGGVQYPQWMQVDEVMIVSKGYAPTRSSLT